MCFYAHVLLSVKNRSWSKINDNDDDDENDDDDDYDHDDVDDFNCCLNINREDKENVNGGYWKMRCAKHNTVSLRVSVCKKLIHNGCTRHIFTAENIFTAVKCTCITKIPTIFFFYLILHHFDLQCKYTLGKVIFICLLLLSLIFYWTLLVLNNVLLLFLFFLFFIKFYLQTVSYIFIS